MVAASRWFEASSKRRKLQGTKAKAANATLAFSPPLKTPEQKKQMAGKRGSASSHHKCHQIELSRDTAGKSRHYGTSCIICSQQPQTP